MKYKKNIKKIISSLGEGDQHNDIYTAMLNRRLEILSRGGKRERSHKKRVGNIINKNIDVRYNAAYKAAKNIQDRMYKRK